MPKYIDVASKIEKKIKDEKLSQGTKLPSVTELADIYSVSKNTILKTLTTLETRGEIYQVQGSGIFVRHKKRKGYITLLENKGFLHELTYLGIKSKLISFKTKKPSEEIAINLNCSSEDEVYEVKRVQYIQDQIMSYEISYYKKNIVTYLNKSIAQDSIFNYIKTALKLNIGFSDKYLIVEKTKGDVSKFLDLPDNSPTLLIEEIYYTTNGEQFDYSKVYYHYEHSQFFLQS